MGETKNISLDKWIFLLIFVMFVIGFSLILIVLPKAFDDWWFSANVRDLGFKGALELRIATDNCRLSNIVSTIFLLIPFIISKIVAAIAFALGLWLMVKVSGFKTSQWRLMALLAFFAWVCPVWEDSMFSLVYAYNYILPIPLLFGMIYMFMYPQSHKLWVGIIIGVLLGAWHESFGMVFVAGAVFNLIFINKKMPLKQCIYILSVIIGLAWLLYSPGYRFRANSSGFSVYSIIQVFYGWIYFLNIGLLLIYLLIKSIKKRTYSINPQLQLFALASGVLIPIVLVSFHPRAMMPTMIICCCTSTILIGQIFSQLSSKIKNIVAILLIVFTFASLTAADIETIKLRPLAKNMERAYRDYPNSTAVFGPVSFPWDASPLTLRRPSIELLIPGGLNTAFLNYYYDNPKLIIVPEELRGYTNDMGEPISQNSECRIWHGHIISPNLNDTLAIRAQVSYGIKDSNQGVEKTVFTNDFGEQYVYIFIHRTTSDTYLGDPKNVDLRYHGYNE